MTKYNSFTAALFFIAASVSSCKSNETVSEFDNRIVIVNIKDANRSAIATLIDNMNACKPRIIGMDIFLAADKASSKDSSLIASIKNAGNVVVLDNLEDPVDLQPEIGAAAHGIAYNTRYDKGRKFYCPLAVEYKKRLCMSMGLVLVMEYSSRLEDIDIAKAVNITWPLQVEDIYREGYKVVEMDSVNSYCKEFNDKIVLLADMQESESIDGRKVISPFLTASSVSYILNYKSVKKQ